MHQSADVLCETVFEVWRDVRLDFEKGKGARIGEVERNRIDQCRGKGSWTRLILSITPIRTWGDTFSPFTIEGAWGVSV